MLGRLALIGISALALASCNQGSSRDQITVVGSSTVYPFTTAVGEAFKNQDPRRASPKVESTGTGAGFKTFCEGVGPSHPDIADASRRMKRSEYDLCYNNGVGEIMEIPVGLDGVALAESNAGPKFSLTRKDVYLALAANPMGKPNTAKTWADVNPALPAIPIVVYGPPATSGTRDAFRELILEAGCDEAFPEAKTLTDPGKRDNVCGKIREDGVYVDSGENDNLIVQKLANNPQAVGIFGYSYLEENKDRLHGIPLNGQEPTYNAIAMGQYPGARPLYIYVKKKHLKAVPGLPEFLQMYATMWEPGGELSKRGLIASTKNTRIHAKEIIDQGIALDPTQLQ